MKKFLYIFIFVVSYFTSYAQLNVNSGIKAGLNYSSSGDLNIIGGLAIPGLSFDNSFESDRNIGYHFGVFAQADFANIYIRSELLFVRSKTTYSKSNDAKYDSSKLEFPILLGYKLFKPFSIYIGPSFQYHLKNSLNDFGTKDLQIDKNVVLGLHVGGSLQIDKFGIDLRYTTNISTNEAINVEAMAADGPGYILDTKSNQFMLSLSYQLN